MFRMARQVLALGLSRERGAFAVANYLNKYPDEESKQRHKWSVDCILSLHSEFFRTHLSLLQLSRAAIRCLLGGKWLRAPRADASSAASTPRVRLASKWDARWKYRESDTLKYELITFEHLQKYWFIFYLLLYSFSASLVPHMKMFIWLHFKNWELILRKIFYYGQWRLVHSVWEELKFHLQTLEYQCKIATIEATPAV